MTNDKWLPPDYKVPKSAGGNYFRFEDGANKFRIMSAPIMGFEYWRGDNKPVRLREKPDAMPTDMRENGKLKHFWAFVVWNYTESKIQILEITQSTIQSAISDLVANDDWGDLREYDITVTRKGKDLDTEYTVQPSPHKAVPTEAHKAYREARINLEALFDGADPFAMVAGSEGDVVNDEAVAKSNPF